MHVSRTSLAVQPSGAIVQKYIRWFNQLGMQDVAQVGGKNASLGEMISNLSNAGIAVPNGFATTSEAFEYLKSMNPTGENKP